MSVDEKSHSKQHVYHTHSCDETMALGRKIAAQLQPPKVLVLRGDLGAGKTTLVKGIAAALGAAEPEEVTSPTFTLIHEYAGRAIEPGGTNANLGDTVLLYHLDLYRIENERQLATLGIEDLMTPQSLLLIEWGEKFPSIIALSDGEIAIEIHALNERTITLRWSPQ
jgi:tRNA threonylcarbamoyladenosine biosynthesis protein TsaE